MRKSIFAVVLMGGMLAACTNKQTTNEDTNTTLNLTQEWDKVFPQSDKVEHKKVTFKNRYGIELAADMYTPKGAIGKLAALAVTGPFGAVKEQTSGLYAQHMAERGFLTIAFDPSFTGESGGEPRRMASPDINTEDFRTGTYKRAGGVIDPLPEDAPQFVKDYYNYYKTPRGYHEHSGNSTDGWNVIGCQSFLNQPLLAWAHEIESPVLLIHGEKAHSRYFSEYAFEKMTGKNPDGKSITIGRSAEGRLYTYKNKELMIIPDAVHTDLYDDKNGKIPYDKMEEFFKTNLK